MCYNLIVMLPQFDHDLFLEAWKTFINDQIVFTEINPIIIKSWRRCWLRQNPHRRVQLNKLNVEHLLAAQVANFELISISRPIMEDIYQFLEGAETAIVLTNAAGYVLDILGDPGILQILEGFGILQGALVSESEMGTNAFALAIQERWPLRVAGGEHYLEQFHELSETASPIFDLTGRPMGSIGVINLAYLYHPHSLALVVGAARAIEGQRQADYLLAEQNAHLAQLNAIVEASSDGILVIDGQGVLTHINDAATRIIGITRQAALGREIQSSVTYPSFIDDAIRRRERLVDVEIALNFGDRVINGVISLNYVLKDNAVRWVIVTLRQEKGIRELIQRQAGAQALLTLEDIPGESVAIRRVHRFVKVAAPAQASILIRGESGTGKNVLASALHNASPRRDGPFVIIGCSSIPHEWVVQELMGYDKSLDRKNPGGRPSKFELADGGTLFFQNIDDLSLEAQAILLNVLDLGIVQRLGSDRPIGVDVRVIASTSANIEKLIAQGNFRADLYYRLSAFETTLPSLRERKIDIPILVVRILTRISRQLGRTILIEPGVMELLSKYHWPGNVRELEAVLGRAAVQAGPAGMVSTLMLPTEVQNPSLAIQPDQDHTILSMYELERESILRAAQVCRGNVSEMAKLLGIGRTTVWRRVKGMDISLDEYRYGGLPERDVNSAV